MKRYRGLLNESYVDRNATLFKAPPGLDYTKVAVPTTLDWRKYGLSFITSIIEKSLISFLNEDLFLIAFLAQANLHLYGDNVFMEIFC